MKITCKDLESSPMYKLSNMIPGIFSWNVARHWIQYTPVICVNMKTQEVSEVLCTAHEIDEFYGEEYIRDELENLPVYKFEETVEKFGWVGKENERIRL